MLLEHGAILERNVVEACTQAKVRIHEQFKFFKLIDLQNMVVQDKYLQLKEVFIKNVAHFKKMMASIHPKHDAKDEYEYGILDEYKVCLHIATLTGCIDVDERRNDEGNLRFVSTRSSNTNYSADQCITVSRL